MLSFKNCNIYLNNKKVVKTNLSIKGNKFVKFIDNKSTITLNDKYIIVPGFIEQHIHGAKGCDTMDGKESSLHTIAQALTQDGVTSWLPTTMTVSKKEIIKVLKVIAKTKNISDGAKIQGVNLEGPFISEIHKGAQDPNFILNPNIKDMQAFIKASGNKILITTVAVEKAKESFFKFCKKNHVIVSIGHTGAIGKDVKKAIKYGLGCSTHTFNAMDKSIDKNGVIKSIVNSNIYREVILDLFHVPKEQALILFKNKVNKLILITDSMEGRYMPNGKYKLGTNVVYVKDGQALLDNGRKAGSVLCISQALKNVKKVCNLSFEQTIDLVSKNPAANLHLNKIGCIKKGNFADFVIVDKNFNVYQTYVNGKLVYDSKKIKNYSSLIKQFNNCL